MRELIYVLVGDVAMDSIAFVKLAVLVYRWRLKMTVDTIRSPVIICDMLDIATNILLGFSNLSLK